MIERELSKTFVGPTSDIKKIFYEEKNEVNNAFISFPLWEASGHKSFGHAITRIIENYEAILNLQQKKSNICTRLDKVSRQLENEKVNSVLHEYWWDKLSTVNKIKNHPREFLAYGMAIVFILTLFLMLSGFILGRIIIAPDFGLVILIQSLVFWLMTQAAKINKP